MLILKQSPKKIEQTTRYKVAKKKREKKHREKMVEKLRIGQDMRNYKKHKAILSKLEVEGLKDIYLMTPAQKDKWANKEERMAIDTVFAMALNEPVYTPEDLSDGIVEYFNEVDNARTEQLANSGKLVEMKNRKPYTLEGLCNSLCISMKTFKDYCQDEKYSDYHFVCNMAKQMIVQNVLEGALMKNMDGNLAKFYLKNVSTLNEEKPGPGTGGQVGNVIFVSVANRKELQELNEGKHGFDGEIVDAETIPEPKEEL